MKQSRQTAYAALNQRVIYEKVNPSRGLYLSVDALDFVANNAPNPCMKVRCCNTDISRAPGDRVTASVETYIPLPAFLRLCHIVLSGQVLMEWEDKLSRPEAYHFLYRSGINRQPLVAKSFSLISLAPSKGSSKPAFAFVASAGQGVVGPGGIVRPKEGTSPFANCFIHMPMEDLQEFALIGKVYAEQYVGEDLTRRLASVRAQRQNYKPEGGVEDA